jgi:hypothetical protein
MDDLGARILSGLPVTRNGLAEAERVSDWSAIDVTAQYDHKCP